jgi:alpha-tubulin suppressor-like RCC1 family protein
VEAGGNHTVALTLDRELWVWGYGRYGQLGLGDNDNRLAPTLVGAQAACTG